MALTQAQLALALSPFTLFAAWSLLRAWKTGTISSRGRTFRANGNPIGFWLTAVCHFGIFAFGLVLALRAMGFMGDPSGPFRIQLPHFG